MVFSERKLLWIVVILAITLLDFIIFFEIGKQQAGSSCISTSRKTAVSKSPLKCSVRIEAPQKHNGKCTVPVQRHLPHFSPILTNGFMQYKMMRLINIRYPQWTLLLHRGTTSECQLIVHAQTALRRKYSCFALVSADIDGAYNLLRREELSPTTDDESHTNSTGFFGNVANSNSRTHVAKKMGKLLSKFADLEQYVLSRLRERSLLPGSPVVVMVVNAGEMDIFANFMCSCRQYNISTDNFIVFSSSADIIPIIERMGVIGIHHRDTFAHAAKHASFEYLDPIFIDMMWYKSFSLWLLLHLGYHVLFQDVDLVWFRDPFVEFQRLESIYKRNIENGSPNAQGPDGFFSDDGQRSLRYAPFYANSGFFYLKSNPRMVYFAWSIMTAFTVVHISGSHQNVFTLRLIEGLDFAGLRPVMLPMKDFPSGVKFSHDRPFMRAIRDGHERPFIFHMCWTKNREHKLVNFHEAGMWHVNEVTSRVFGELGNASHAENIDYQEVLNKVIPDRSWRRRSASSSILPHICRNV